ncbi:MAG: RNA methyltransferase [Prevotellaceae bacterium]|jgi:tRNA G18 (ribose-2'-O)-methylase SpoU|nr:RNA methyltransferase [Prevotellaceae bacterium]
MRKLNTEEIIRISQEEFRQAEKIPLVVVLDNVRSLHNVGSVFRTSDAYRVEKVLLCGITAAPPNAEIHKSALGAEFSVDWQYFRDTLDAVKWLKDNAFEVLAVEQTENSVMLNEFKTESEKKYAVILGNEVFGVQQSVIDQCRTCLELPQFGTKHSLNVSVTAGIVIWEMWGKLK